MPKPLQFDMVFLDHLKPLYTVDIKVMEEEGLIGPVSYILFSSQSHTIIPQDDAMASFTGLGRSTKDLDQVTFLLNHTTATPPVYKRALSHLHLLFMFSPLLD